jgi:hypothetical protein
MQIWLCSLRLTSVDINMGTFSVVTKPAIPGLLGWLWTGNGLSAGCWGKRCEGPAALRCRMVRKTQWEGRTLFRNLKGLYMILPPNHNSQDLTTISSSKGASRFYIWSFWTFYLRFINKDMRPRAIETPHGAGPSWSWNHWVPRRQTGRTSQGMHVDTEQQNAISKCQINFQT